MKKGLFILFLFLGSIFLYACDGNYPEAPLDHKSQFSPYSPTAKEETLGIQSIIKENEWYTVSAHYPVSGHEFIDSQINQFVSQRIDTYEDEVEFQKKLSEEQPFSPYELHLSYEIPFKSNSVMSIRFTERKSLGESLTSNETYTFNYDLKKAQRFYLSDILSPSDYNMVLYDLSLDVLHKDDQLTLSGLIEPTDAFYSNFVLTNTEVQFWLNPSLVKNTISEPFMYEVPLSKVLQFLNVNLSLGYPLGENDPFEASEDLVVSTKKTPEMNKPSVGSYREKKIALSFEGGPHPVYTPIILQTLQARGLKASFFYLGKRAEEYPNIVVETAELGHDIGNGSYSSPQLTRLSNDLRYEEIERTQNIILGLTQTKPTLFRPPFGQHDEALLKDFKMPIILWNIDPEDKVYNDPNYITSHVLAYATDGGIIRLHDSQIGTAQAMGAILDSLEEAGYQIVPISELLAITPENASSKIRVYNSKN